MKDNFAILQFTPTVRSAFLSSVSMSEDSQLRRLIRLPVVRHQFQWLFPIPRFGFSLKPSWWGSNSPLCYSKKLYKWLNVNYMLRTANVLNSNSSTRPIGCRVLAVKCSKNDHQNLYQTAHQNDGFNALWLYCSKLNPACSCYDFKPAKLRKARWAIQRNFSTNFSDCQIWQVRVTFKSDQAQWHSSWSSFLTES